MGARAHRRAGLGRSEIAVKVQFGLIDKLILLMSSDINFGFLRNVHDCFFFF